MIVLVTKKENLKKLNQNQDFLSLKAISEELDTNPFGRFLLDIENQQIIAYLYYSDIYERAEINQFEVSNFHRDCGKGSNLLKKMITLVDKNITLEVKKDNIIAIHLYKKFKFKEKATRKNYYQGIDGLLMEREKSNP